LLVAYIGSYDTTTQTSTLLFDSVKGTAAGATSVATGSYYFTTGGTSTASSVSYTVYTVNTNTGEQTSNNIGVGSSGFPTGQSIVNGLCAAPSTDSYCYMYTQGATLAWTYPPGTFLSNNVLSTLYAGTDQLFANLLIGYEFPSISQTQILPLSPPITNSPPTPSPSFRPTVFVMPTSSPTDLSDDDNSGLSGGAVAGVAIAVVFGLTGLQLGFFYYYRGRFPRCS
jgi:hypothetical protein